MCGTRKLSDGRFAAGASWWVGGWCAHQLGITSGWLPLIGGSIVCLPEYAATTLRQNPLRSRVRSTFAVRHRTKCSTRLSSLPASPWPLLAPSSCAPRAHDPGIVCLGLTGACCPPQDWLPDRRQPWSREHQGIVEPGAQGVRARHDGTPRSFLQPPPLTRVRLACVAVWPFFHVVVYLLDRFLRSTIATRTGTS